MKNYELRSEEGRCLAVLTEAAANKLMSDASYVATYKEINGQEVGIFEFTKDMAILFPINGWTFCIYEGSYLRRQ